MNAKRAVRISKFVSLVLRHDPAAAGVVLDANGWADVDALLAGAARAGMPFTAEELRAVVARSDKQRFALSADERRIRANQGHSVAVDLELPPAEPPAVLYHGTVDAHLESILAEGLRKRSRQHVHLSADVETARRVGARRGRPVILAIDAAAMHARGHSFWRSANGVWLADAVPREFLSRLGEPERAG